MKWFPHQTGANRNSKLRQVVRIHGMAGYGLWWTLLEKLYEAEGDFQIEATELWLADFADDCKITDPRTLTRVFDTFAEVGLISKQLWADQIIFCESILEKGDQYIQKRAYEAEKKRKQRAKNKVDVPTGQKGDRKGTEGQIANVPLSEIRDHNSEFIDPLPPTPFPEDKQKASMNASLVRSRIFRSGLNDWNEPLIAAWISLWKQSGRDPGTDGINLRSFVRKNLHPNAEKHASMLDELTAAEKIAERSQTSATYQPPPEPEIDPSFKPPTVAEILARRGRES